MAWLNDWLKQLIAIVLIAGFVDLLLPSQAMQRYAKAVIGLFLLLALLSPVLQLLRSEWSVGKLTAAVDMLQDDTGGQLALKPLDDIMKEAETLQAGQRQQAQRIVETRLASSIAERMEQDGFGQPAGVTVKTSVDKGGKLAIDTIAVTMPPAGAASATTSPEPTGAGVMKPVKPVVVDIRPGRAAVPATAQEATNAEDKAEAQRLRTAIAKAWSVKAERVSISYEAEGKP
ncbi:stage III sporulation protein AF [Paenibacillus cymbidii]|uniref:stage III sporulation protein AF n=1 Tax=Paenibacillus cymbidii TaxID=1639034 RepID=UPI0010802A1B|nr:stage III sporulation protein AF [Paenibacillus cymbidii]